MRGHSWTADSATLAYPDMVECVMCQSTAHAMSLLARHIVEASKPVGTNRIQRAMFHLQADCGAEVLLGYAELARARAHAKRLAAEWSERCSVYGYPAEGIFTAGRDSAPNVGGILLETWEPGGEMLSV